MKKILKQKSGITLIALVITIIVLLILAGISISMLSGDNSILQKATDAKIRSNENQIKEKIQLAELSARTDGKGNVTYSKLNEELTKEFGERGTGYNISDESESLWVITVDNVEYTVANSTSVTPNTSQKLVDIVTSEDYGKSIDYSVSVNGQTLNNWKVFLNDGNNVYIILANYLPGGLGPDLGGYPVEHSNVNGIELYETAWDSYEVLTGLGNQSYFTDFVDNNVAVSATGAPTLEQLKASCGATELGVRRHFNWRFICDFK